MIEHVVLEDGSFHIPSRVSVPRFSGFYRPDAGSIPDAIGYCPVVPRTLRIAIHEEDWIFKDDRYGNIVYIKPSWKFPEPKGFINYTTGEFVLPFQKSNRYDILKNKIKIIDALDKNGQNEKVKDVRVEYAERENFVWRPLAESEIPCSIRGDRPFYRVWLDDEKYFIYDFMGHQALYFGGLLTWDILCFNTDFHNEFLECKTIIDIHNLLSRWCWKNKISDPQDIIHKEIMTNPRAIQGETYINPRNHETQGSSINTYITPGVYVTNVFSPVLYNPTITSTTLGAEYMLDSDQRLIWENGGTPGLGDTIVGPNLHRSDNESPA
jgi:hypothetical protein